MNKQGTNRNRSHPGNLPTLSDWKKAGRLLLYLTYAEVVVLAGIKLGAFHKPLAISEADIKAAENSMMGTPQPQLPVKPLPSGILAFDQETNQATVHEGEAEANFVFHLRNVSKRPVVINAVITSCGCTVAKVQPLPWTLKPLDKGQIAITMNVLGYADKSTKGVTVYTDQGSQTLEVVAIIAPVKPH